MHIPCLLGLKPLHCLGLDAFTLSTLLAVRAWAGRHALTGARAQAAGTSCELYIKVDSMDSWTVQRQQGAADEVKRKVGEALLLIKTGMPQTYEAIQRRAAVQGAGVYTLVRRAVRGEANCFWAMEGGRVVGTPFAASHPVMAVVAQGLVQFGCAHVCILAEVSQ